MKGICKVTIIGTLGKAPEARTFPDGGQVSNFSVAVNESWKDKQGSKVEHTEWLSIVAKGKLAEICNTYLQKGSKVFIEGRIRTRSYDKDGEKRYVTEIMADGLVMLDGKSDAAPTSQKQAPAQSGAFDADFEDTIPF